MTVITNGGPRSPPFSGAHRTTPPSARRLLRHKKLRTLRAMRAMVMVSSGSNTVQRMSRQSQHQRAVMMAAAGILTTCERLGAERLIPTQVSAAESSQEANDQVTACRQVMSPAPVAVEPSILAAHSSWEEDVPPESYLLRLLEKRGRQPKLLSSTEAGYTRPPTEKQVKDYSSKPFITDLVRKGDIEGLEQALRAGRGMDASNKFGESVVHVACRTGNLDVLRFLIANGGSLTCCDDLGRFPLHEVCWAVEPRFDIVRLFLDSDKRGGCGLKPGETKGRDHEENRDGGCGDGDNSPMNLGINLLLVTDKRGCTPLRYVKQDSWPQWRTFLEEIVEEY